MTLPDIDAISAYGGLLADYYQVEDPTTDESALSINQIKCNVAMSTFTQVRALCAFVTANTAAPTDPASNVHFAVWGNSVGVKPTVARTGVGTFTITWPATVQDQGTVLNQTPSSHTVNLRRGRGWCEGSTWIPVQVAITSPNVATVYAFNSSGTLTDTTGNTLVVCVW